MYLIHTLISCHILNIAKFIPMSVHGDKYIYKKKNYIFLFGSLLLLILL